MVIRSLCFNLCRGPALSVSGPALVPCSLALCVGPRRCRAPPLSRSLCRHSFVVCVGSSDPRVHPHVIRSAGPQLRDPRVTHLVLGPPAQHPSRLRPTHSIQRATPSSDPRATSSDPRATQTQCEGSFPYCELAELVRCHFSRGLLEVGAKSPCLYLRTLLLLRFASKGLVRMIAR